MTARIVPCDDRVASLFCAAYNMWDEGRGRVVMHVDANCFYAGVEMFRRPELRGRAVVVGGDEESRHGIVLAKSPVAKAAGVKTGDTLWQARVKCPGVVVVPPDYLDYIAFSRDMRELYYGYSDRVEPFGLDECWVDLTGTPALRGSTPELVAQEVSERVKYELGIAVSVGVSWCKPFAKLGSDVDAGDGVYVVDPYNFMGPTCWGRPASDLIGVGPATTRKLAGWGIGTVGELACAEDRDLLRLLGKVGPQLAMEARGLDLSPVARLDPASADVTRKVASVGNGLTAPHDIVRASDAKALLWRLAESVAQRLRQARLRAATVEVGVRHKGMDGYTSRQPLPAPTCATSEIAHGAWEVLRSCEPLDESSPIRALHVRACNLSSARAARQGDLFGEVERREALERLDGAIDDLRSRMGNSCVMRGVELADGSLEGIDIQRDNVIHPVSYGSAL